MRLMAAIGVGLVIAAIIAVIRFNEFNQVLPPEAWQNTSQAMLDAEDKKREDAKTRWERQQITHYELVIDRTSALPSGRQPEKCIQDVEVRAEAVTNVLSDTCADQPGFDSPAGGVRQETTVSGLFDQLAADTSQILWSVEGIGCNFLALEIAYDDDWGYPHRIAYHWQPPPPEFGFPIDRRYFLAGTPTPAAKCESAQLVDGPVLDISLNVLP